MDDLVTSGEKLGARPGDRRVELVQGDRLIVTFIPARHRRSVRGRLRGAGSVEDFADFRDGSPRSDRVDRKQSKG